MRERAKHPGNEREPNTVFREDDEADAVTGAKGLAPGGKEPGFSPIVCSTSLLPGRQRRLEQILTPASHEGALNLIWPPLLGEHRKWELVKNNQAMGGSASSETFILILRLKSTSQRLKVISRFSALEVLKRPQGSQRQDRPHLWVAASRCTLLYRPDDGEMEIWE
ncbi:unnamed protein product [Pleuronectes platessa]|uniref:Uncharacterized protein n=1 Tax=Pleuronectes platessa TaxID=8262 RepID=A0A9N7V9F7_PLEPL|nr:unnamed protein product [Pleuronectes platessa]